MRKIKLSGPMGKGKFALVDDEDYEEMNKYIWCTEAMGYAKTNKKVDGKYVMVRMHREIMKATNLGREAIVDHINHNKLDNRKENLRICTNRENIFNYCKKRKTRYQGLTKKKDKWIAKVTVYVGSYDTQELAAIAYNKRAKEILGDKATLNILSEARG